jgi:diguanylate cyclase (GGDEF)-like protein
MHKLKMPWLASFEAWMPQHHLRAAVFAAVDHAVTVLIVCGFAAMGVVPYAVALKILAIVIVLNVIVIAAIGSGYTRRFRDPAIIGLQVAAACAINLSGLLLAPQIAYVFIMNLFVSLSYGGLYFSRQIFLRTWLLLACLLGAVMVIGDDVSISIATPDQRLFFWGVAVLALGRFLSINAEMSRLRAKAQKNNIDLTASTAKLAELASRDELTGLWNRREFMRLLQDESRRAVRSRSSFCVAFIDIDHFTQIIHHYGHPVGDKVLHELARLLDSKRRATDSLARYGDNEFSLLLVNPKRSTALVALERIRNDVAQYDWESIASGLELTLSAGIADWQPGETLLQTLNRAGAALYEAKTAGRNCVRIAPQ